LDNLNQNLGSPKNCLVVQSSLQSGLAHLACEVVLTAGDLGYMVQNLAISGYYSYQFPLLKNVEVCDRGETFTSGNRPTSTKFSINYQTKNQNYPY
jgi:hypothetical protein